MARSKRATDRASLTATTGMASPTGKYDGASSTGNGKWTSTAVNDEPTSTKIADRSSLSLTGERRSNRVLISARGDITTGSHETKLRDYADRVLRSSLNARIKLLRKNSNIQGTIVQ